MPVPAVPLSFRITFIQPVTESGRTHASSVIADERSSDEGVPGSGTVTKLPATPVIRSAPPANADRSTVRTTPVPSGNVPLFATSAPTPKAPSLTVVPLASLKSYDATSPAFRTLTRTSVDDVAAPALLYAIALTTACPVADAVAAPVSGTVREFHGSVKPSTGVVSDPTTTLFTRKSTRATSETPGAAA